MWQYRQSTGELTQNNENGNGAGPPVFGYSGHRGAIPQGKWYIGGPPFDTEYGPYNLYLIPSYGTDTYGRYGFLIQGDSAPDRSEGIVLPQNVRESIWLSGDHELEVIA